MYQWTGNIGLVNVTDLLRASTSENCKSATDQHIGFADFRSTCENNYLIDDYALSYGAYWTITAFSTDSNDYSDGVWYVGNAGVPGFFGDTDDIMFTPECATRPVLFLKSTIRVTSGIGTKTDPYLIEI